MTYKLTITQKPGYLHVIVTGSNNQEDIARYLEEVRRECASRGCLRLLIEERLEGPRLGTTGVFQVVSEVSGRVLGSFEAVAYVDVNAEGDLNSKFAETVAVNRGLPLRVFLSVSDAERWLQGGREGGTRASAPGDASEPRR